MKHIEKLKGGSNAIVLRIKYSVEHDFVSKRYEIYDQKLAKEIIRLHLYYRNKLKSLGILVPRLYKIFLNECLCLVEDYVGISLREHIRSNNINLEKYIEECRKIILTLPEDIPLDVNSGNFVIDSSENIYFIDFMPPNPWNFLGKPHFRVNYENAFPSVKNIELDKAMKSRYFSNKARLDKLHYYVELDKTHQTQTTKLNTLPLT